LKLPDESDTIATHGYVRSHGGAGGVGLSTNNFWTGTNEYSNTVTFDQGINIYLQSVPTIGFTGTTGSLKLLSGSSYGGYTTINPSTGLSAITLTLPSVSGTVALLSDISSSGAPYPSGSGIPIVSSGTSWGTTITNNSSNWNTAYGWGNHASAGYLTNTSLSGYGSLSGNQTFTGLNYFSSSVALLGSASVGQPGSYTGQLTFWSSSYSNPTILTSLSSSGATRTLKLPDESDTIATHGYVRSRGYGSLAGTNTWVGTQTLNNTLVFNAVANNTGGTIQSVLYKNVLNISGLSAPITITLTDMVDGQIMWISNNDPSWAATVAGVSIAHGKSALCRYVSSSTSWKVILSN
jgi:hypothetical protein